MWLQASSFTSLGLFLHSLKNELLHLPSVVMIKWHGAGKVLKDLACSKHLISSSKGTVKLNIVPWCSGILLYGFEKNYPGLGLINVERSPGTFLREESKWKTRMRNRIAACGEGGPISCFDYEFFLNQIAILKSLEGSILMVNGVYLWRGSLGKDRSEGLSLFTSCVAALFELLTTSVDHFLF